MEQTKIKDIFNLFVATDTQRPELMTPFKQKGFYFATDAHSLIALPIKSFELDFEERSKPDALGVLTDRRTQTIEVDTEFLNYINESLPMTDETITALVKCNECYGSGQVTCNYDHEHDCPECDGEGEIEGKKKTGNKIKDTNAVLKVWGILFRYQLIKKVFDVATELELKSFQLIRGSKNEANIFQLNDFIILLMPTFNFKDTEYTEINSCTITDI